MVTSSTRPRTLFIIVIHFGCTMMFLGHSAVVIVFTVVIVFAVVAVVIIFAVVTVVAVVLYDVLRPPLGFFPLLHCDLSVSV